MKYDYVVRELISEEKLKQRLRELGGLLTKDYQDKEPILVCVLKGGVVFLTDLMRELKFDLEIGFITLSSYGESTVSSGRINLNRDLDIDITGRHVIIIEDIIDSGHTLFHLSKLLSDRQPASLRICTLLDKPSRRQAIIKADYTGFEIADEFVVGYGLDYAGKHRNLRNISVIDFK